jgi:hypothetical protein
MPAKRTRHLIGILLILLIGVGLTTMSCNTLQDQSIDQDNYLGLSSDEFEMLDSAVHEYLYQRYPFLSDTEFHICYEKVDKVLPVLIVDAAATFRMPPLIVRAAVFDGCVIIISERVEDIF